MKKYLKTVALVLLNVLFCATVIWLFTQNSVLRPYAGSFLKEALSALLLLGSLYANYFLLYPRIYKKYSYIIYWAAVVFFAIVVGIADLAIAYPFIVSVNPQLIKHVGYYNFFSTILYFSIGRNLALNFFPYLFRERQQLRHSLEKEREIVYERVRMLDVTDKDSNILLLTMDDILYCEQQRNFTTIHAVKNETFTRLGSMKHLEQLFGDKEFIRITTTLLVPFQYIQSCEDNGVVMKKMLWEKEPTTFQLDPKTCAEIAERIAGKSKGIKENDTLPNARRKPATPPEEKQQEVLAYIGTHPNCNSADIVAGTDFSLSTIERCLFELKKQGLIEHTGSKKSGGYKRVCDGEG